MSPYLAISYEKVSKRLDCERYAQSSYKVSHSIRDVTFTIVDEGKSYEMLDCLSEDIIDFCSKIYFSSFTRDCFGLRTANILEYDWRHNKLIVHGRGELSADLTTGNVEDIKIIANPNYSGGCSLY